MRLIAECQVCRFLAEEVFSELEDDESHMVRPKRSNKEKSTAGEDRCVQISSRPSEVVKEGQQRSAERWIVQLILQLKNKTPFRMDLDNFSSSSRLLNVLVKKAAFDSLIKYWTRAWQAFYDSGTVTGRLDALRPSSVKVKFLFEVKNGKAVRHLARTLAQRHSDVVYKMLDSTRKVEAIALLASAWLRLLDMLLKKFSKPRI